MLFSALLVFFLASVGVFSWKVLNRWIVRRNKAVIFQWGKFVNSREGVKNSAFHADEDDIVRFTDYKYWIRLFPNRGVNLPLVGYWSKAKGRRR
jgi:hypothetical protein